jgi:hypothetical protein
MLFGESGLDNLTEAPTMKDPLQILVMLFLLVSSLSVSSQELDYMDGNRLLRQCAAGISDNGGHLSADQYSDFAFCNGYIAGTMDANNVFDNSIRVARNSSKTVPVYCLPKSGIELQQAVRITVKYLREHPEKLHFAGDILVWMSLQQAFPCK